MISQRDEHCLRRLTIEKSSKNKHFRHFATTLQPLLIGLERRDQDRNVEQIELYSIMYKTQNRKNRCSPDGEIDDDICTSFALRKTIAI